MSSFSGRNHGSRRYRQTAFLDYRDTRAMQVEIRDARTPPEPAPITIRSKSNAMARRLSAADTPPT